jgi:putative NADH-flavin reductase
LKIAVFGATGRIGSEIVKQALERGHLVTAFVRNPDKMMLQNERLTIIKGAIHNVTDVEQGVLGQDAVICALGARDLKSAMIRIEGTINIIEAMKRDNVKRLFVISAMGVGESWNTLSLVNKAFLAVLLKSTRKDHEAQEVAVKSSGLDWTIIRPSGLTNSPRTGNYRVGENIRAKTYQISRGDVADLILNDLEKRSWVCKAVTITN